MQISVTVSGLSRLFGDDLAAVVDVARIADDAGIHQLVMTDHLAIGPRTDRYPFAPKFPYPPGGAVARAADGAGRVRRRDEPGASGYRRADRTAPARAGDRQGRGHARRRCRAAASTWVWVPAGNARSSPIPACRSSGARHAWRTRCVRVGRSGRPSHRSRSRRTRCRSRTCGASPARCRLGCPSGSRARRTTPPCAGWPSWETVGFRWRSRSTR